MAKPGVNINNIVCDFIMISLWFYSGFIMMFLMTFFRGQIMFIMFYVFFENLLMMVLMCFVCFVFFVFFAFFVCVLYVCKLYINFN